MKRIILSLGVILAVTAMVAGGTTAFFSDTETSSGNILKAGSIDLKIDHKYMVYNGEECEEDCVENTNINLVENGGFEVPEVDTNEGWDIFSNGTTGLAWTVEWESSQTIYQGVNRPEPALVEYHEDVNPNWPAYEGDQYAELDTDWDGPGEPLNGEPALVRIYQDINTVSGQQYKIHYAYSPRPDVTNAADNELKVRINGNPVATHSEAGNGSSTAWEAHDYTFTASSNTTRIEFAAGGTADSLGVFLDAVRVHPVDCTYELNGNECELWEETDLTDQRFFNFEDIKPGDLGKHVISLHVYDNDAYACMYTQDNQDNDNGLTEPESLVDSTGGDGEGELSEYLEVFVWADDNNDGLYQPTAPEADLAGPASYKSLFIDGYGLDTLNLTATTTEYLGFTWCAGTLTVNEQSGEFTCDGAGMGNEAQSDSLVADLVFYTEQMRNNDDFSCSDLIEPVDLQ